MAEAPEQLNDPPDASQSKVQIRLSTRHQDITLPEDPGVLLVSTGFRRYALSTLVNNLLQTEKPIPFEFLINGQFLRTTIDEFLTENGISAETTLNVEYIRALIPPQHVASFEHDDWVSAVDVLSSSSLSDAWGGGTGVEHGQERILSGSYDGLLRVWNSSSEQLAASTLQNSGGRVASIKSAKFLSPSRIASAGLDMAIRIWDYDEQPTDGSSPSISPRLELYGHNWGVESIAVHGPSSRILSASSDHTVGIWSSKASEGPAPPQSLLPNSTATSNKRIKLAKQSSKPTPQRGPLNLLRGHTAPASSVIFAPQDPTVAYSVSHDHTLRTWDLPTGALVDTRTTGHALLSLAAMSGVNLLAAGTSARHITLIDPRASATTVAALTLRGHTNAVVALAPEPDNAYGLVSGSHDGTCRIWDIRSTKHGTAEVGGGQVGESAYTIVRESVKGGAKRVAGEGVKVLSVCWDRDVGIVSGGEDRRVQINRGNAGAGTGNGG